MTRVSSEPFTRRSHLVQHLRGAVRAGGRDGVQNGELPVVEFG